MSVCVHTCMCVLMYVFVLLCGKNYCEKTREIFMTLQICSLLRGGIAERGGVRVGHRIIEINNQSVVAVPHEKIVNLLATSVGEVKILFPNRGNINTRE